MKNWPRAAEWKTEKLSPWKTAGYNSANNTTMDKVCAARRRSRSESEIPAVVKLRVLSVAVEGACPMRKTGYFRRLMCCGYDAVKQLRTHLPDKGKGTLLTRNCYRVAKFTCLHWRARKYGSYYI